MNASQDPPETPSWWQVALLLMSVFVLGALLYESTLPVKQETRDLLHAIDTLICVCFLTDFFIRFSRASNKWRFMRWGWIDFLSSIPLADSLRWGRIIRIVRIIRAFRSTRHLIAFTWKRRGHSTFALVSTITILLIVFAAITVMNLETGPESNIESPLDALWWSIVTVTTVGYGDRYPVTPEGRIVAMILMIAGVGLFGTFTGFVASLFNDQDEEQEGVDALRGEVDRLHQRLDRIESLLEENLDSRTSPRAGE